MAGSNADALRDLGIEAFNAGDYDLAIEKFDELIDVSDHPFDHHWRILTLQLLQRYSEVGEALASILRENSEDTFALHHLGLLKACCSDQTIRDGQMAIELSTRLCEISEWTEWLHVSVLAAAYAEVEDWESAERFAHLALELAPDSEKGRREARLNQYRNRSPHRTSQSTDQSLIICHKSTEPEIEPGTNGS